MNEEKYTQRFKLPNGEILKIHESYKGEFYAHCIQTIYHDQPEDNQLMSGKWKALECDQFERSDSYLDRENNMRGTMTRTFVTARNLEWDKGGITSYYDSEFSSNCEYHTKIEIVLMVEEYKRRFFIEWDGAYSLTDWLKDLEDNLNEEFLDNYNHGIKIYEEDEMYGITFYSDKGESIELEIDKNNLASMISSIKIVTFNSKIVK